MTYKLTIDVNMMQTEEKNRAMETLKRWGAEGKIELVEADRAKVERDPATGWPGAPSKPMDFRGHRSTMRSRPSKSEAGGPTFKGVAGVLFPHKDPQKLNMGEVNSVAHLMKHHSSKNELFITMNAKDFIEEGRRESLKAQFGVVTLTPEEAVTMLTEMEGWK